VKLTTHLHLTPRIRRHTAMSLTHPCGFMALPLIKHGSLHFHCEVYSFQSFHISNNFFRWINLSFVTLCVCVCVFASVNTALRSHHCLFFLAVILVSSDIILIVSSETSRKFNLNSFLFTSTAVCCPLSSQNQHERRKYQGRTDSPSLCVYDY
jgi:hypothetical protein